jgi:hypothetical protein
MRSTRFAVALTLGSLAAPALATPVSAHRNLGPEIYRSAQAISYELGSKRAIGYFLSHNGVCQLTLMVAEAVDMDIARPLSAAKMTLSMLPGQSTALASEEGESIQLACGAGGETMIVRYAPHDGASPQGALAAQSDRVVQ